MFGPTSALESVRSGPASRYTRRAATPRCSTRQAVVAFAWLARSVEHGRRTYLSISPPIILRAIPRPTYSAQGELSGYYAYADSALPAIAKISRAYLPAPNGQFFNDDLDYSTSLFGPIVRRDRYSGEAAIAYSGYDGARYMLVLLFNELGL